MNFAPKVGPLVAELLSGVTALLIIYFDFHGFSFKEFDELTSGAIVVLVIIAWIIGTFFRCRSESLGVGLGLDTAHRA
jgi:hypothetical protein